MDNSLILENTRLREELNELKRQVIELSNGIYVDEDGEKFLSAEEYQKKYPMKPGEEFSLYYYYITSDEVIYKVQKNESIKRLITIT